MRLVYTDKVGAGAILAKSILNEREQVLLHEGAVLTDYVLARLIELGIPVIYIKNHVNEVSELDMAVSEELRKKQKLFMIHLKNCQSNRQLQEVRLY